MADDLIISLNRQVQDLQSQFKVSHKLHQDWQKHTLVRSEIQKEMRQMEEEKQQLQAKIGRLQRKVEYLPNCTEWLDAARGLRMEQTQEYEMRTKMKEIVAAQGTLDQRSMLAQLRYRDAKSGVTPTPENMLQKLREDVKVNKYLLKDQLDKTIEQRIAQKNGLEEVRRRPTVDAEAIRSAEGQVADINHAIALLTQQKMKDAGGDDAGDRLAVFRQQASTISNKRNTIAEKLQRLLEAQSSLESRLASLQEEQAASGVPFGDQFKKYAAEMRSKSLVYKDKKKELGQEMMETNILERTTEILKSKVIELKNLAERQGKVVDMEFLRGARQPSEFQLQPKEMTVDQLTSMIDSLIKQIEDEKNSLAPIVKQVKIMRENVQVLERQHQEKTKQYDAVMMGVDVENAELERSLDKSRQEVAELQSQVDEVAKLVQESNFLEVRAAMESKMYAGADDDDIQQLQKTRGFKTYREHYAKKIAELETACKQLRDTRKESDNSSYLDKELQREMFMQIKRVLVQKVTMLKQTFQANAANKTTFTQGNAAKNTLVL